MVSVKDLIEIIKAYKKWDTEYADKIIDRLVKKLEQENKYRVARDLRKVYSQPFSAITKPSFQEVWTSSLVNSDLIKSDLYDFRKSNICMEDIVLSDLNSNIIKDIRNNHHHKDLFSGHNLDTKTRILLYWPPWTWKTLFTYALAGELNLPVMHIWLDQLISSYLWETGKNIRKIFDDASKSNCIIFLDEFDSVAKHRDDITELWELKRVVTVLLQYIDSLSVNNILIAATNHYHLLDSAIIRRFEYIINLWLLDRAALSKLFEVYLKDTELTFDDYKEFADISENMSWAIIKQVIDKSMKKWLIDGKEDKKTLKTYISTELLAYQLRNLWNDPKNKDKIINYISYIQKLNSKYTYKDFENLTWIPDSTLNWRITKRSNKASLHLTNI